MSDQVIPSFVADDKFREAIKEWQRDPSLLAFLRVLLHHHIHFEQAAKIQSKQNLDMLEEQFMTLAGVLESMSHGKRVRMPAFLPENAESGLPLLLGNLVPTAIANFWRHVTSDGSAKLPPILRGRIDKARLVGYVRERLTQFDKQNASKTPGTQRQPNWGGWAGNLLSEPDVNKKFQEIPTIVVAKEVVRQHLQNVEEAIRQGSATGPNWREQGRYLLALTTHGPSFSDDVEETPWRHAVTGLKMKWEGPSFKTKGDPFPGSNFSGFLREWIARRGDFSEPDDKTKELARLSRVGVQHVLLENMRRRFPQEAIEWFGGAEPISGDPRERPYKTPPPNELVEQTGNVSGERRAAAGTTLSPARHSKDFRSVHWYGHDYFFTEAQARIVEQLWSAWENGTSDIGHRTLLSDAGVENSRLQDVFKEKGKMHPAWGTMILTTATTKGTCRLQSPI